MAPAPGEYAPYFGRYVSLVPEGTDLLSHLEQQAPATVALIRELDPDYRYAPGKWSVKQALGHLTDTERVMAYRLLRVSRGDTTPLPGFDQDVLVNGAAFDASPIGDLLAEFEAVRRSTLFLLRGLTPEMWPRLGHASGHPVSARALAYIIAGHELYHVRLFEASYRGSATNG